MSLAKPIQHINVAATSKLTSLLAPNQGMQLRLYSCRLVNESGGSVIAAVFKSMSSNYIHAYTYDGTSATDVSIALQNGQTVNAYTSSSGTGFLISAPDQFQAIQISVISPEAAATLSIQYWNGSAYVAVPQVIDSPALGLTPSGNNLLFFSPGSDWVPGGNIAGQNQNEYTILITATGQSGAATINSAIAIQSVQYVSSLPNNAALETAYDVNYPLQFMGQEQLYSYFSVASDNNKAIAFYSQEN